MTSIAKIQEISKNLNTNFSTELAANVEKITARDVQFLDWMKKSLKKGVKMYKGYSRPQKWGLSCFEEFFGAKEITPIDQNNEDGFGGYANTLGNTFNFHMVDKDALVKYYGKSLDGRFDHVWTYMEDCQFFIGYPYSSKGADLIVNPIGCPYEVSIIAIPREVKVPSKFTKQLVSKKLIAYCNLLSAAGNVLEGMREDDHF